MREVTTDVGSRQGCTRRLIRLMLIAALGFVLAACSTEGSEAPVRSEATAPGAGQGSTAGPPDARTVAEHLQDATLAAQIRKALLDTLTLRAFDFEADVRAGRVVLRGTVRTAMERSLAEVVAREVPGVRRLDNEIVISTDSSATRGAGVDSLRREERP